MGVVLGAQKVGHYELKERLGSGGMAEVFLAASPRRPLVAVKRVLPGLAVDEEFRAMFWDEACIMAQLAHPNVVRLFDYGEADETLYLALEYVDGPSVARYLRKAARDKFDPNISAALSIVTQLLTGLEYVHGAASLEGKPLNIVHRDISPGNVLLTRSGQAKLGDFGIVRSEFLARRTQPGELKGKIGYMSPEQAEGLKVDCRSDLFSAGIILAELLTLRPLFLGKSEFDTLTRTVKSDLSTWHRFSEPLPEALRAVTERALAKNPAERFTTAREMKEALVQVALLLGIEIECRDVAEELIRVGLTTRDEGLSGERPRVDIHLPGPSPVTSTTVRPGEGRVRISEPAPVSERDSRWVGLPAFRRGRGVWRAEFRGTNLMSHLFAALRRVTTGGVELTFGSKELYLEVVRGRIVAAHDGSSGLGFLPLGKLLVDEGALDESNLEATVTASRVQGVRLGEYLLSEGRIREGVLDRLLARQFRARLGDWVLVQSGRVAALVLEEDARRDPDFVPDSIPQVVEALREAYTAEGLSLAVAPFLNSSILPACGCTDPVQFGLTSAEWRVLKTVLEGGVLEGRRTSDVLREVVDERLARRREAEFALLVGLSSGILHAPL
jgi:serine/threonine protein kinase